ncbi:MAG: hypothetical protein IKY20_02970 [Alistipes sp.]|nr:hypothetical protein [Alistipes sp.]
MKKNLSKYLTNGIQWLYICSGNKRREVKAVRDDKEIKEIREVRDFKEIKDGPP